LKHVIWSLHNVDSIIDDVLAFLSCEYLPTKTVNIDEALHKYSAQEVYSNISLPPYPKATMDGYAVISSDCEDASHENPVSLKVVNGRIRPWMKPNIEVKEGECVEIETGGFLPKNTDAVVRVEDTTREGNRVIIFRRISRYENVSIPGEELKAEDRIISRGELVRPWHIAAFKLLDIEKLEVYDLSAHVIATGDEFLHQMAKPYTIDLVSNWLIEHGFEKITVSIVPDVTSEIASYVSRSNEKNLVTVVLGGSSVGKDDYSITAVSSLNPDIIIHGAAIKPGKTVCTAVLNGKLIVVMSGLPVAALSSLEQIVKPILSQWIGLKYLPRPKVKAILTRRITTKSGVREFVRIRVFRRNGKLYAEPIMTGGSGSIGSLVLCNAWLITKEEIEGYEEGEEVEVELIAPV